MAVVILQKCCNISPTIIKKVAISAGSRYAFDRIFKSQVDDCPLVHWKRPATPPMVFQTAKQWLLELSWRVNITLRTKMQIPAT